MPWAMLLRAIARLAGSLLVWRMATARRGAQGAAAGAPVASGRTAAPPLRLDTTAAARLRDAASLGWRAFSAAVLLVATTLLVSGGVTLTVLTPRWLGIVLLVLAVASLTAAFVDLLAIRRIVVAQRQRRRADALRREVS
jgi:hypothetical protein